MFKRVSVALFYIIVAFTTLVAAGATTTVTVTAAPTSTEPASQCNTGDLQCCDTVEPATSSGVTELLGLLGIVLTDLNVLVGITCTPITVIGLGSGGSCTAQPVCCENNNFNGVVNIGCTPVNLGL